MEYVTNALGKGWYLVSETEIILFVVIFSLLWIGITFIISYCYLLKRNRRKYMSELTDAEYRKYREYLDGQ